MGSRKREDDETKWLQRREFDLENSLGRVPVKVDWTFLSTIVETVLRSRYTYKPQEERDMELATDLKIKLPFSTPNHHSP